MFLRKSETSEEAVLNVLENVRDKSEPILQDTGVQL